MNADFSSAAQLLALCEEQGRPISAIMRAREAQLTGQPPAALEARMARVLAVMRRAAAQAVEQPRRSMGGLIGGEAQRLCARVQAGHCLTGPLQGRAVALAMGMLEVNASMGLIVAAPTAGACGVLPGVLLALEETCPLPPDRLPDGLWNAGAVGYLAMRNANVAGAVGGCQAEVGVAAAMAASAAVELLGGTPAACLGAASTVLMNMLGLVCDPVGGLVEYPCQMRNAAGVANALTAAELALAGVRQRIPLDEMLCAMDKVGRALPPALRETAQGGCAACRLTAP